VLIILAIGLSSVNLAVGIIILRRLKTMSEALDRLKASVESLTAVDTSAVALITGLAEEIRNNVDDSDALNALADKLDSDAATLSAAVTANTPAASPAPTPEPAPEPAPEEEAPAPEGGEE
jgi:hypothetical protein